MIFGLLWGRDLRFSRQLETLHDHGLALPHVLLVLFIHGAFEALAQGV